MTTQRRMMWFTRTQKHLVLAAFLYIAVYSKESDLCMMNVGYPRAKLNHSIGDSLTLNCTVMYCNQVPETNWCKVQSNSCHPVIGQKIQPSHLANNTEGKVFVLYTISSMNLTDSGTYRCYAKYGDVTVQGNSITVNVFEPKKQNDRNNVNVTATNSTMMKQNPLGTPLWIFYTIIVMGILGTVLFVVLITYFCIRNFTESQETKEPTDKCERNECNVSLDFFSLFQLLQGDKFRAENQSGLALI
ncbi:B- and T-lymphocyte attenuator [Rhincodon typus]|uniref:B- and T-lymphocyte attenuator n=1 Tax=Rhincodon typus TaxID=259920 RepID=UPI00203074A0|nr:B- and T-lymphocyte attenuator [Rhincodon typus]